MTLNGSVSRTASPSRKRRPCGGSLSCFESYVGVQFRESTFHVGLTGTNQHQRHVGRSDGYGVCRRDGRRRAASTAATWHRSARCYSNDSGVFGGAILLTWPCKTLCTASGLGAAYDAPPAPSWAMETLRQPQRISPIPSTPARSTSKRPNRSIGRRASMSTSTSSPSIQRAR